MSAKTKKLALLASAPDEVKIEIGMEFSRIFKREAAPFQVEAKWAKVLLRSYDFFVEFEEVEPETLTFTGLMKLNRDDLNTKAREHGVSEPEKLADKKAVANATLQAAQPKAEDVEDAGDTENKSSDENSEEEKEKEQD